MNKFKSINMWKIIPDQQWKDVSLLLICYVRLCLDVLLLMINMVCSLTAYKKGRFLRVHFLLKKKKVERGVSCILILMFFGFSVSQMVFFPSPILLSLNSQSQVFTREDFCLLSYFLLGVSPTQSFNSLCY